MFRTKLIKDGLKPVESMDEQQARETAEGTVAIVFGGTKGIGRAIANSLNSFGAKQVVVVGRSLKDPLPAGMEFVSADLSSLKTCSELLETEQLLKDTVREADNVVFTVGITPKKQREASVEGVEMDMAVSYLSRLLLVRKLAEFKANGGVKKDLKIWVMGFPGVKSIPTNVEDLNAEKEYKQFGQHLNTVVGNESIVHHFKDKLNIFGLNPGMISTDIRKNFLGGGMKQKVFETVIGLITTSAKTYGQRTAMLMMSQELRGTSGLLFNQKCREIQANPWCNEANVEAFLAQSDLVVNKVLD